MGSVPSMFATHGLAADRIAQLGWALTLIGSAVSFVVVLVLLLALARRRPSVATDIEPDGHAVVATRWIVVGGALVPGVIVIGAFVYALVVQGAIAAPPSPPALTIEVVAHRWWWEVRYDVPTRAQAVATANEIHIPIGRPVRIQLATHDVIHSVWVPQLAGKTDAVNGQTNVMWLEARTAGIYRGECAEYCGVQHANMSLTVVAEDSTAFAAWLAAQRAPAGPAGEPVTASGAAVFLTARCAACHTVRGSGAHGVEGPDLTHLATRATLGAGLFANTQGNLAGWVSNAPALKPGIEMPPTQVGASQLRVLLAYLESLR